MIDPEIVRKAILAGWKEERGRLEYEIPQESTGHSFNIFSPFFSDEIRKIKLEDPYFHTNTHERNINEFLTVIFDHCPNLEEFHFITRIPIHQKDIKPHAVIVKRLKEKYEKPFIWNNRERNIRLEVDFSPQLHDRKLELNDKFKILLGRGIDIFISQQQSGISEDAYKIVNNRPCRETTLICLGIGNMDSNINFAQLKVKNYVDLITNILVEAGITMDRLHEIFTFLKFRRLNWNDLMREANRNEYGTFYVCRKLLDSYGGMDGNVNDTLVLLDHLELTNSKNEIQKKIEELITT